MRREYLGVIVDKLSSALSLLAKPTNMNNNINTTNVFIDTIKMETQTVFNENGAINICPCGFELGQHIVATGNNASQKGRMVTEDDGTSRFTPYRHGSGSRYTHLHSTAKSTVKMSRSEVIVETRFPILLPNWEMRRVYDDESRKVGRFLRTDGFKHLLKGGKTL